MNETTYKLAKKMADRDYKYCLQTQKNPYISSLEDIISVTKITNDIDLGIIEIPLEYIVGTLYTQRTNSFSNSFLPLLDVDTEFARKWQRVYEYQLEDGINEPIEVYEYKHLFYVKEGNKRVSVLKYLDSVTITAHVKRIPVEDDPLYDAFVSFFNCTNMYEFYFHQIYDYENLTYLLHETLDHKWSLEKINEVKGAYYRFCNYFRQIYNEPPCSLSDAFLKYITIFRYDSLLDVNRVSLRKFLKDMEAEFQNIDIHYEKEYEYGYSLQKLHSFTHRKLRICFIHDHRIQQSQYILDHDIGRHHIENVFGNDIETMTINDTEVQDIDLSSFQMVFSTSASLTNDTIRYAIQNPNTKFYNCAIQMKSQMITFYETRDYEIKFLMGVLAGIYSSTNHIGYIENLESQNELNGFAIGVSMSNPNAIVHCYKTKDEIEEICDVVCFPDYPNESDLSIFGLCYRQDDKWVNIASCIHKWGIYYAKFIDDYRRGYPTHTTSFSKNIWLGLNEGVIDLVMSNRIPMQVRRLIQILHDDMTHQQFSIFQTPIRTNKDDIIIHPLNDQDIVSTPWYFQNVIPVNKR